MVVDTRPLEEFNHIALPDGIAAPGAELLFRVFDAAPDPATPIVVNCAGRTRAIIGAQALINAGVPNPVVSLENGTAAWLLDGLTPAHGATREAAAPSPEGLARARQAQQRLARRFGIAPLSADALEAFRADATRRTLYLFDIRTEREFDAGHLPGSRHVPGGQLVQNTDRFIGTRQGRIVLADTPDLVRSTITASWLLQLGLHDVHVYPAEPGELSAIGPVAPPLPPLPEPRAVIAPLELSRLLAGGKATVLDLDPAEPYFRVRRFIPGSFVARRSTLAARLASVPGEGPIVLTSGDGVLAAFAASDPLGPGTRPVLVLQGGTEAWIAAGLGFQTGSGQPALHPSEALPKPLSLPGTARLSGRVCCLGPQHTRRRNWSATDWSAFPLFQPEPSAVSGNTRTGGRSFAPSAWPRPRGIGSKTCCHPGPESCRAAAEPAPRRAGAAVGAVGSRDRAVRGRSRVAAGAV